MAEPFVIGRDNGCDLVLAEGTVSGRHATVALEGDSIVISDCSRNGTFVKASSGALERVPRVVLAAGQVLSFGGAEMRAEALLPLLSQHFSRPLSLGQGGTQGAQGGQFRAVIRRPQRNVSPAPIPPVDEVPAPQPAPQPVPQPVPQPQPEPPPPVAPHVVLWGERGSGKSTWLLHLADQLGQGAGIGDNLAKLRAGLPASPGPATPGAHALTLDLWSVRLSESTAPPLGDEDVAALICFVRADGPGRQVRCSDLLSARSRSAGPVVLVISHCDLFLKPDDAAWNGAAGWWRALPDGSQWDEVAQAFGGAVFPVGNVGYAGESVALCADEFGGTMFLAARPMGIDRPLRHLASLLQQAGR